MLRVNSKDVMPGDTFLALRGSIRDGHDYINEAIDNGASCVIAQEGNYDVKTIIAKDTRTYLAKYLGELWSERLKKIELIAVAGTRGKTSSAYLTYSLLTSLGLKCAYVGSLGFYMESKVKSLNNTTPDLYELYDLINEAVNNECDYFVLEVTNLALKQRRLEGLKFKIAALTNVEKAKLDCNFSFEEYVNNEIKLFEKIKRYGYAIINNDDSEIDQFILPKNQNVLFGKKADNYKISNVQLYEDHSIFNLMVGGENLEITLPFPLEYNIYNYVISFIIASLVGYSTNEIILATPYLKLPKGIYQVFEKNDTKVIVDNASLPASVASVTKYAKKYTSGKIIIVIGCKGTTDKEFRQSLGKTVVEVSDYVIFTTDSPYKEEPEMIINDMIEGIEKDNFEVIVERKEAIKKGIGMLMPNDTLLVLGRGTEEGLVIGSDSFSFSDITEVSKHMKK